MSENPNDTTMKTYWLVESNDTRYGTIARLVGSIQAEESPECKKIRTDEEDIYLDWFNSRSDADVFLRLIREGGSYG
jgi:hypothetical protein